MHILSFIYTPDGTLRGGVDQIVQQLDLMPTLLGLLGNEEPYFAFGRDVFNEPQRPRWSISYDGGFRALTDEGVLFFDDTDTPSAEGSEAELLPNFRALVQQYYTRTEQKNYTAND